MSTRAATLRNFILAVSSRTGCATSCYFKGNGAIVMSRLCKCADIHGLTITLYAYEANRVLIDYYRGFGFIADNNGDDEADMVRFPLLRH